ncbi:MAG: SGNH/GDSL hydrolase family protein [Planctomycetota bacterium]|jgi:lysophospholipase L1-like esterase|nr:SGNH/GDSL hydrolase family protein [Planctomycetota bacterium]MDP6988712.1 SGNH/GDSL hydrolase family protein [Planctomycetota bacterium]
MSRNAVRAVTFSVSLVLAVTLGYAVVHHLRPVREVLEFQDVDEAAFEAASASAARHAGELPARLRRTPLDEETVRRIMPLKGKTRVYDPFSYFRHAAGLSSERKWAEHPRGRFSVVTNSLGLRQDDELAEAKPDLRVLVVGDSHMTGVCSNAECFPAQLEDRLAANEPGRSVEVVNGSHGAYAFYHYLGVLERMLDLGYLPDVFVVVVYGGNDFLATFMWHLFGGTQRPRHTREELRRKEECKQLHPQGLGQALNAAEYFRRGGEEEVETALRMARAVMAEIRRLCRQQGTELVAVYLPSPSELPDHADQTRIEGAREVLGLSLEDLAVIGTMGDRFLADLRGAGYPTIDLRETFRGSTTELYWRRDLHLNLAGHAAMADVVAGRLEQWWGARAE